MTVSQCEKEVNGDTGDQRQKQDKGTHGDKEIGDGDESERRKGKQRKTQRQVSVRRGDQGKIQG